MKKIIVTITTALTSALIFIPLLAGLYLNPFDFNQFLIQRARINQGFDRTQNIIRMASFLWRSGTSALLNSGRTMPRFDASTDLFEYVLANVPRTAYVYPTEGFYYWNATHPLVGPISGNIRLADLGEKESLSFAYFPVGESWVGSFFESKSIELNPASGLEVKDHGDHSFTITFRGISRTFHMPINETPTAPALAKDEVHVGKIIDESGVVFDLLFNERTWSFYDVLDEASSLKEPFIGVSSTILVGARTRFAYINDPKLKRKVLIGINEINSKTNSYFDGPGDQVPYWLDLKERLNRAYPATLLEKGINSHGVYLGKAEWVRIAVTPFHIYTGRNQLTQIEQRCQVLSDSDDYSTCITKEWWNSGHWLRGIAEKLKGEGRSIPESFTKKIEMTEQLEQAWGTKNSRAEVSKGIVK
jgi:hypothetical protein